MMIPSGIEKANWGIILIWTDTLDQSIDTGRINVLLKYCDFL